MRGFMYEGGIPYEVELPEPSAKFMAFLDSLHDDDDDDDDEDYDDDEEEILSRMLDDIEADYKDEGGDEGGLAGGDARTGAWLRSWTRRSRGSRERLSGDDDRLRRKVGPGCSAQRTAEWF